MAMDLKSPPPKLSALEGSSSSAIQSPVPTGEDPRHFYISNENTILAPLISHSPFIPAHMVEHLMRHKKNSALGVKFRPGRTDAVTNMEGALHTYVTPVMPAFLHGDYHWGPGHGMVRFKDIEVDGKRAWLSARRVIISASIQPDFEYSSVMLKVCGLGAEAVEGVDIGNDFEILDVQNKQDTEKRDTYDTMLRQHMIYHLTAQHRLPGTSGIKAVESPIAMNYLETQITAAEPDYDGIRSTYVNIRGSRANSPRVISVEVLFNSAIQQLRNEISSLEAWCRQGYVLTIDPPSIFAQEIGASLLNRIQIAALRCLADGASTFTNMRVFAFNDYADGRIMRPLARALQNQDHVKVLSKSALFPAPEFLYQAPQGAEDALLVVHNNSDAFGQNIETEFEGGSLDGAIGANSSAAASLLRTREDLLDKLM